MKLRTFILVRCTAMWVAGAVLALSVVAWIASLWGLTWSHQSGLCIWLMGGDVIAHNEGSLNGLFGFDVAGYRPPSWSGPHWSGVNGLGYWMLVVPLWLPGALAGTVLGLATIVGRRTLSRVNEGRCLTCGYDLTGIDGVCPECGREVTLPSPSP